MLIRNRSEPELLRLEDPDQEITFVVGSGSSIPVTYNYNEIEKNYCWKRKKIVLYV
jgi:hypothetical protein